MTLDVVLPVVQTGAVGAMLIMTWKLMVKKDQKSYTMIEEQNKERKEMYESMKELIAEVTAALVNKNATDDKMSLAVDKLAEQLRGLKERLPVTRN